MAFSGVLVTCGFLGGISRYVEPAFSNAIGLPGRLAWSEKLTNGGTTTNSAPAANVGQEGQPSFEISNSTAGDIFIAYGPTPDLTNGPVLLVRQGDTRNVFCRPGDRLAWAAV